MCVNNLSKVALDSAATGIEPVTSSRKSNALTTAPPSHTEGVHCTQTVGGVNKSLVTVGNGPCRFRRTAFPWRWSRFRRGWCSRWRAGVSGRFLRSWLRHYWAPHVFRPPTLSLQRRQNYSSANNYHLPQDHALALNDTVPFSHNYTRRKKNIPANNQTPNNNMIIVAIISCSVVCFALSMPMR